MINESEQLIQITAGVSITFTALPTDELWEYLVTNVFPKVSQCRLDAIEKIGELYLFVKGGNVVVVEKTFSNEDHLQRVWVQKRWSFIGTDVFKSNFYRYSNK